MDTSVRILLGQFVQQIQYDCHSTAVSVQRSEAFKALRAKASEAFPQAVTFFSEFNPSVGDLVQEGIQEGLAHLLMFLGKELHLADPPGVSHTKVQDWVRWGREAYAAAGWY